MFCVDYVYIYESMEFYEKISKLSNLPEIAKVS